MAKSWFMATTELVGAALFAATLARFRLAEFAG